MLRTFRQTARTVHLNFVRVIVLALPALALTEALIVRAADDGCVRETIWVQQRLYGGRIYNDFVSCGSSAGNFAYTCDDSGECFENTVIDPSKHCRCDVY